jgi:hypothetical protein
VKKETGVDTDLQVGRTGQFDVLIDGEVVASREKGFLTRLLGGGWPDPRSVVDAVRDRQRTPA